MTHTSHPKASPRLALLISGQATASSLLAAALISPSFGQVNCPPGSYTEDGSTCIPASLGHYVPIAGATRQTPADPGHFVDTTGSTSQTLAPAGFYVPAPAASSAIQAQPGFFVPDAGSTSQTSAQPGTYVPSFGAIEALSADLGFYVPNAQATEQTEASPGHFVAGTGATMQTPADLGFFVPTAGATSQLIAPPGTYVPSPAATSARQADPGFFVSQPGSSSQTAAQPGTYVPNSGASSVISAQPGFYVPTASATGQIEASPGSFVSSGGASGQTLAPPGTYAPSGGLTSALINPTGTWTPAGAVAPRAAASGIVADGNPIVGPSFQSDRGASGSTIALGAISARPTVNIDVENASDHLGSPSVLTGLTLKDVAFIDNQTSSPTSDLATSFSTPLVLDEQQSTAIPISYVGGEGSRTFEIRIGTDQQASFGGNGQTFSYLLTFDLDLPNTFANFQTNHFTAAEIANDSATAFLADFDGDGVSNGLEYVFGLDPRAAPTIAQLGLLPTVTHSPNGDEVAFVLPEADFPSVVLRIEESTTLAVGEWQTIAEKNGTAAWAGSATITAAANSQGSIDVSVVAPALDPAPDVLKRFFRLTATEAE